MGHRILSHILNIEDEDALKLVNGNFELDSERIRYLDGFISICRRQRLEYFDEDANAIDHSLFYAFSQMVLNDRHVFNIWREELGGRNFKSTSKDSLIVAATNLALELYPVFLIKITAKEELLIDTFSHLSRLLYKLDNERKKLCMEVMRDTLISKLFPHKDENGAWGSYISSSGIGGQIHLSTFPSSIINNAFLLLRLRGIITQEKLAESIEDVINMVRQIAKGEIIKVPLLMAFNNVGMIDKNGFDTEFGTIKPFTEEIIEIIDKKIRPSWSSVDNAYLGFILESEYEYEINFEQESGEIKIPERYQKTYQSIETKKENIFLALTLAIRRDEPIGVRRSWVLHFDPLSHSPVLGMYSEARSLQRYHLVQLEEQEAIKFWASKIHNTNDEKIRIAIRRILIAINERSNPNDGFLDAMIAWDSLFGSSGEVAFKISISIAKVLRDSQDERKELQKEIAGYYRLRNDVVHGGGLKGRDITEIKNKCIIITLNLLRELYVENQELLSIEAAERSRILALNW